MKSNTLTNRFTRIEKIIVLGLLLVIVANLINRIFSSPFDFDEGVGLILSKILFSTGKYSTYERIFDPIVTVGPTVYLPTALSLVFGNVFIPRVVIMIYSLLLILISTKIIKEKVAKIFLLCLVCLTPYFFYFSSHVLGEIPAIFYSLTGLYFLSNKKYFISGVFLALSIMTKSIFLLSLVPAFYLLFTQKNEISLKKIFSFILPFILINGLWEFYKLFSFDFSFEKYFNNFYQLLKYNKSITVPHPEYLSQRLQMLSGTFGLNGILFLIFMVALSLFTILRNKSSLINSIAIYVIIYLLYYFGIGSTVWYRHFFPTIVLFIIILADSIGETRLSKISLIPIATAFFVIAFFSPNYPQYFYQQNLLPLFDQVGNRYLKRSDVLNQQIDTAEFIKSKIQDNNISGIVWYNAPEISYLSNKQILRLPEDKKTIYLISHPFGRLLVPSVDARISEYPYKVTMFETPLYTIYKKYE